MKTCSVQHYPILINNKNVLDLSKKMYNIYICMLAIAGQTARQDWLTCFYETHGYKSWLKRIEFF